jgi:hypothetical protein
MAAPFSTELFALVRGEQTLGLHIMRNRPREEFGNNAKGSPRFALDGAALRALSFGHKLYLIHLI